MSPVKNLVLVKKFEGELYSFVSGSTLYHIAVTDLGDKGVLLEGGRFLVTVLSPTNKSYCLNWDDGDYIAPNYIKEKFSDLGDADAENIACFLNEYFAEYACVKIPRSRGKSVYVRTRNTNLGRQPE